MKKIFEKNETLITILLIVAYVIVNSYCMQNFGTTDYRSTIINTIFSGLLLGLIAMLGRFPYYGLTGIRDLKKYLYFLPLVVIMSVNLWNGINIANTGSEILFHFLCMMNVGFLEEMIFRGFLFKMMEKDQPKRAMLISALTFGIGHIVNLLNGSDVIPTMMQICYAVALGYLFVVIFVKSKSLLPCIITHMVINSLSIFNIENTLSLFVIPAVLVVLSIGYVLYLNRAIKE